MNLLSTCRHCQGEGCTHCNSRGWNPTSRHAEQLDIYLKTRLPELYPEVFAATKTTQQKAKEDRKPKNPYTTEKISRMSKQLKQDIVRDLGGKPDDMMEVELEKFIHLNGHKIKEKTADAE